MAGLFLSGIKESIEGMMGGGVHIGLSIGSSSIKLSILKSQKKEWKLVHFGRIQIPDDAIVNREIVNHIAVVERLKALVDQFGNDRKLALKGKKVAISLSGNAVIIKRMSLDVPNMKELREQVFWEAEQYLPFEISEVEMDYHIVSARKGEKVDVILAAVKKSVLEAYMDCVREVDLKPTIADVDFFAMHNIFELNYPEDLASAVALIDIGASSIKIVVSQEGIPLFTKDSSIGGANLTSEIQKHMGLSFEDAENLKVAGGAKERPQEVSDLMNIMCENLAGEIKRAFDFYNASSTGGPISSVILTGGSAQIPDLARVVEETTGVPTQMINPFHVIGYEDHFTEEEIESITPYAAIPLGLALRKA